MIRTVRKVRLPELPETGRFYLENTQRARLANPGVERYRLAPRSTGGRAVLVAIGLAALAALAAAAWWLAR